MFTSTRPLQQLDFFYMLIWKHAQDTGPEAIDRTLFVLLVAYGRNYSTCGSITGSVQGLGRHYILQLKLQQKRHNSDKCIVAAKLMLLHNT